MLKTITSLVLIVIIACIKKATTEWHIIWSEEFDANQLNVDKWGAFKSNCNYFSLFFAL